jgi:hypothetical protein
MQTSLNTGVFARSLCDAGGYPTVERPWSIRAMNTMTATTSRTWMNPPIVYELTIPSSHKTTKTIKSVESMLTLLSWRRTGVGRRMDP